MKQCGKLRFLFWGPAVKQFGQAVIGPAIAIITIIAVIKVMPAQPDILAACWLKKRFQRRMIAETALTEGVEVARLHGTQRVRGKEMVEAIPEAVPVTPAPALLLRLYGVAMQPAIDIVQIVADQLTQNAQLKFMLPAIFERIVPWSLDLPPRHYLSFPSLLLCRIKVATAQPAPL